MIKRVTFLRRIESMSLDEFRRHWRDVHGPIGAKFLGVRRYLQNGLVARITPVPDGPSFFDGIVEYWFDDVAGPTPGRDPEVARELEADAPLFVDGLTGFEVDNPAPYVRSRYKLWVVGRWVDDHADVGALHALSADLAGALERPSTVVAHAIEPDAPTFARDILSRFEDAPRAIVIAMIGDEPWSTENTATLKAWLATEPAPFMRDLEAFITEEVVIVPGPEQEA